MANATKLYLLPVPIGELTPVAPAIQEIITGTDRYIVEEIRTARRFIKKMVPAKSIEQCTFVELNEQTAVSHISHAEKLLKEEDFVALMSEAGIPCVADPGWQVVRMAHAMEIPVSPQAGTSSIFTALMASGLQGQRFMFHGYLPVKKEERIRAIRDLEQRIRHDHATQIFMETPYRNNGLIQDILSLLNPALLLSISAGLDTPEAMIKTRTIGEWKKHLPELHKIPAVFVLGM